MSDQPAATAYHVVAVKFEGEDRAEQVVDLIKKGQKAAGLKVKSWVVVKVDEKGKAHVKQTGHGAMGATLGGATGIGLALIGGPAGLLVWLLGGALLGGVAGKYMGRDFDSDQVKAFAASMEPNTSALLMVLEDEMLEKAEAELGLEGEMVTFSVGDQLSGEFETVTAVDLGEIGEGETGE